LLRKSGANQRPNAQTPRFFHEAGRLRMYTASMRSLVLLLAVASLAGPVLAIPAAAQSVPAAIFTDPPADKAHPAAMSVLHIPTHGLEINGIVYSPAGAGPHPTVVLCHGLPGNEKNLDLAQAIRRAGWNAVTFNYRGSWGSPGKYRFAQNLEDADAVLAYIEDPANAAKLGIDTRHIVLAGHSLGGWVTTLTASHHPELTGAILISAADMGLAAGRPRDQVVGLMKENSEALNGTPEGIADDAIATVRARTFSSAVPGLTKLPLLVLSANDGLAPMTDVLVQAVQKAGSTHVTAIHADTDHGWNDHRIFLETTVLNWLATLK
jgi:pimeloyl-ACP methyl ester carboxylesterase